MTDCKYLLLQILFIFITNQKLSFSTHTYDINKSEQCTLCALCKPSHAGVNETRDICSNPSNLSDDIQIGDCFPYGDWCDLIGGVNPKENTSLVSILPPRSGDVCYFNISFFDLLQNTEIPQDTVFVAYTNDSEQPSAKGKWAVKKDNRYNLQVEYEILAKKGMSYELLDFLPAHDFL